MSPTGTIAFAVGGSILLFLLYVASITVAQSPYGNIGPIIGFVLPFGFIGFLLLGIGLFLIIKSAIVEAQSQTKKG